MNEKPGIGKPREKPHPSSRTQVLPSACGRHDSRIEVCYTDVPANVQAMCRWDKGYKDSFALSGLSRMFQQVLRTSARGCTLGQRLQRGIRRSLCNGGRQPQDGSRLCRNLGFSRQLPHPLAPQSFSQALIPLCPIFFIVGLSHGHLLSLCLRGLCTATASVTTSIVVPHSSCSHSTIYFSCTSQL